MSKVRALSLLSIFVGVAIAVMGKVRTGSVLLALGTGAYTYLRWLEAEKKRRIELFLPLLLAVALVIVALTLPHGG